MASKNEKIYYDKDGNEMKFYINADGFLFLNAGRKDEGEEFYSGYIVMDKLDVEEMILELQEMLPNIKEEE